MSPLTLGKAGREDGKWPSLDHGGAATSQLVQSGYQAPKLQLHNHRGTVWPELLGLILSFRCSVLSQF